MAVTLHCEAGGGGPGQLNGPGVIHVEPLQWLSGPALGIPGITAQFPLATMYWPDGQKPGGGKGVAQVLVVSTHGPCVEAGVPHGVVEVL